MKLERTKNHKGSVAIMALVICLVGTIGMTAWISTLNARSGQVDQIQAAIERRTREANGVAAAREFVYRNVVTKDSGGVYPAGGPPAHGWYDFRVASWAGAPMAATALSAFNHCSFAPYLAYTTDFDLTINDGVSNTVHRFQVKSRSSNLARDVFVQHKPTLLPGASNNVPEGDIRVFGRAVLTNPPPGGNLNGLRADEYITPFPAIPPSLPIPETSGVSGLPDNYPMPAMTNGEVSGAAYNGELNVVDGGAENLESSLLQKVLTTPPPLPSPAMTVDADNDTIAAPGTRGVISDGAGFVNVFLNEATLGTLYVADAVRLDLWGQFDAAQEVAAEALSPVMIVIVRRPGEDDFANIRFHGSNARRLIVGIKKQEVGVEIAATFDDSDLNPIWRLLFVVENADMNFVNVYGGTSTIKGGLRSDRDVRHTEFVAGQLGQIHFVQDDLPQDLETLDAREAWVEVYKQ